MQKKHTVRDIPLSLLDKTFIKGFEYYLTIDRKLKRSSVSSALSTLHSRNEVDHLIWEEREKLLIELEKLRKEVKELRTENAL